MPTRLPFYLSGLALALTTWTPWDARAAEWEQLPHPSSTGLTVYADPATARLKRGPVLGYLLGNPVQAWFVTDYAQPHRWGIYPMRSIKQWLEIDCEDASLRVLARQYFEHAMAQGRVVATEPEAKHFTRVAPGEVEEAMLHSACARPEPEAERTQRHTSFTWRVDTQAEPRRAARPAHDAAVTTPVPMPALEPAPLPEAALNADPAPAAAPP